jgi:hypothetical protein
MAQHHGLRHREQTIAHHHVCVAHTDARDLHQYLVWLRLGDLNRLYGHRCGGGPQNGRLCRVVHMFFVLKKVPARQRAGTGEVLRT